MSMQHIKLCIGIDPGVHNGLAVYNRSLKVLKDVQTLTVAETLNFIAKIAESKELKPVTCIYIENPDANSPIFKKRLIASAGVGYEQKTIGSREGRIALKVAQDVGRNKEVGRVLLQWAQYLGIQTEAVTPVSTKWDKAQFLAYTGYKGKVTQHAIDGSRLVWGR